MSSPSTKPVIVIVHGAFHPPIYYRKFIEPLRAEGYTVLAPALPTTGLDDSVAGTTYVDDVRRIYESLLPLLDDGGREAVIVAHSQVSRNDHRSSSPDGGDVEPGSVASLSRHAYYLAYLPPSS